MEPVTGKHDAEELRELLEEHAAATGSAKARAVLARFEDNLRHFKKILPRDYDKMLRAIAQFEERGMDRDEAELEAFYAVTRGGAR